MLPIVCRARRNTVICTDSEWSVARSVVYTFRSDCIQHSLVNGLPQSINKKQAINTDTEDTLLTWYWSFYFILTQEIESEKKRFNLQLIVYQFGGLPFGLINAPLQFRKPTTKQLKWNWLTWSRTDIKVTWVNMIAPKGLGFQQKLKSSGVHPLGFWAQVCINLFEISPPCTHNYNNNQNCGEKLTGRHGDYTPCPMPKLGFQPGPPWWA